MSSASLVVRRIKQRMKESCTGRRCRRKRVYGESGGYRGKAEGAASIVSHNGGFVRSGGGWVRGSVCAGMEARSCTLLPREMRPLVGAARAAEYRACEEPTQHLSDGTGGGVGRSLQDGSVRQTEACSCLRECPADTLVDAREQMHIY